MAAVALAAWPGTAAAAGAKRESAPARAEMRASVPFTAADLALIGAGGGGLLLVGGGLRRRAAHE